MCRPRSVSPPPEGMIAWGEEMVKFVKDHPDILHLSEWYTIEKGFTYNEWKTFIVKEEFFPYYEQAMRIIGLKYLDKASKVRDSISHRWQRIYFPDLRQSEDEDFEANEIRRVKALKGDARASEEEKQRVLSEINDERRVLE